LQKNGVANGNHRLKNSRFETSFLERSLQHGPVEVMSAPLLHQSSIRFGSLFFVKRSSAAVQFNGVVASLNSMMAI
jgi:hypothetical protein